MRTFKQIVFFSILSLSFVFTSTHLLAVCGDENLPNAWEDLYADFEGEFDDPNSPSENITAPASVIECGASKSVTVPLNLRACQSIADSNEPGRIFNCDHAQIFNWETMCPSVLDRPAVLEKLAACRTECQASIMQFYRDNYAFVCNKPPQCPKFSTCQKRVRGQMMRVCNDDLTKEFTTVRIGNGMCQARCIIHYSKKLIGNFDLVRSCDDCVAQ